MISALTHNAPNPPEVPETHIYDVVYVAVKRACIYITEHDTIKRVTDELNTNKGEAAADYLDNPDSAKVHVLYPSHDQTLLELLLSNCLLHPDPRSEAYLAIIEEFNTLRVRLGTPEVLSMIFHLGQLNPTK